MPSQKPITNIAVELSYLGSRTFPLCCDYDGARYHLWIYSPTLEPADETLYKNPPIGATGDDRYPPRTLRQNAGVGKILVPAMMAKLPELHAAAVQACIDRNKEAAEKQREEARIRRIQEAGPELLVALRDLLRLYRHETGLQNGDNETTAKAHNAIAKATR